MSQPVETIQWVNTVLNIGVIPLMGLLYKLSQSIDKLRLEVNQQFLSKVEFTQWRNENFRRRWRDKGEED